MPFIKPRVCRIPYIRRYKYCYNDSLNTQPYNFEICYNDSLNIQPYNFEIHFFTSYIILRIFFSFSQPGVEPEQPNPPTCATVAYEGDREETELHRLSVVPWLGLTHYEFSIPFVIIIISDFLEKSIPFSKFFEKIF